MLFDQHSFVKTINNSLVSLGMDASIQLSPSKSDGRLMEQSNYASNITADPPHAREDEILTSVRLSRADATCGESKSFFHDWLDAPHSHDDALSAHPTGNDTSVGLNQTVNQLLAGLADSPEVSIAVEVSKGTPSRIPKPVRYLPHPKETAINSSEGLTAVPTVTRRMKGPRSALVAAAGDYKEADCSLAAVSGLGDLTMMEFEHRDLFERLASAVSCCE